MSKVRNHDAAKHEDGIFHGVHGFTVKRGNGKRDLYAIVGGYSVHLGYAVWRGSRWHVNSVYSHHNDGTYVAREQGLGRVQARIIAQFRKYGRLGENVSATHLGATV